jgi:hypothetical protein
MASTQADRGRVSGAAADSAGKIVAFAKQLLSFAEQEYGRLPGRRVFALAGRSIGIGFSDPEYAAFCDRAYLARSSRAGDEAQVRLAVLDYESLPHTPRWTGPAPGLHEVTTVLAEQGLRGAYDASYTTWDIYDPARALGAQAMPSTSPRPPWEPSFPLRLLLHWAGRAEERGMIHAGTLGHRGRGVFLVGAGGSGKSGTTLSGILNGLSSVGDDYVAVSMTSRVVEAQPVLRLMKQDIRGIRRLGLEVGKGPLDGRPNWQGKIEFDYGALAASVRAERLAMTAILMPHITRSTSSSLRPASAREAMLAMAPSSLYQLHGSWREDFGLIASIARALPAFHLDLSDDPAEIAAAIRAFIEDRAQ